MALNLASANSSLPQVENWKQSQVTFHPTEHTQQLSGTWLKFLLYFLPSKGMDELGTVGAAINN